MINNKLNVGVIGLGWWGPKLLRNFIAHDSVFSVIGCDADENRRHLVEEEYHVSTVGNAMDLVNNPSVDALVVATPPSTHYEISKLGLEQGKHILLTKPPTLTLSELEDLIRISECKGVVFMLDSAFVFAPSTKKIKSMLEEGSFPAPTSGYFLRHGNDLQFHHVSRIKNTMFRNGIDVVEDLLFHDLALITYLFGKSFHLKSIHRFYNLDPHLSDTATLELESDHFPVHISLSWTLPERKRHFIIFARDRYLLFDELRGGRRKEDNYVFPNIGKLHVFEFETKAEKDIPYEKKEPLFCEVDHFVSCLLNGKRPLTDGTFMLQVLKIYDQIRHAKE